jgi:hypothetical protein
MTGGAAGYCVGGGFTYLGRSREIGARSNTLFAPVSEAMLPRDEEAALLRSESQRLKSVLETIERRLAQIETT